MTTMHRHVKVDINKFTRDQLVRRIKSLEQYVHWLEERERQREQTKAFFHGETPR